MHTIRALYAQNFLFMFLAVAVWPAMKRTEQSQGQSMKRSERIQKDQCPKFVLRTWNASNENNYGQLTSLTGEDTPSAFTNVFVVIDLA